MAPLSQVSKAIISIVESTPGCSAFSVGEGLKGMGYEGDNSTLSQVPNNLKLLEEHGYLVFEGRVDKPGKGWYTTAKGESINKYGG